MVFQFTNASNEDITAFKDLLETVLKNIKYYVLSTSVDVYNPSTSLVVIHGLKNISVAKTFDQLLTKDDKRKIKKPYFVVSSGNYQIIQIHKNLDTYLNLNNN